MKYKLKHIYDTFRYDIPRFLRNIIHFRKALWRTYSFDYSGSLHYMRDHFQMMEPVIRNGYHVHGDRTADRVKVCKLLLDRILDHTDQYFFDDIEMNFLDKGRLKFKQTPRYSEAPRESKYQHKILMDKEKNDWYLLMKLLHKHMQGFWE